MVGMEEGVDCARNPELCVPGGLTFEMTRRASSGGGQSSNTLVTVISVLSIGLILGLAALGYFWRKSKREQVKRKDVEKECSIRAGPAGPNAQRAFILPEKSSLAARHQGGRRARNLDSLDLQEQQEQQLLQQQQQLQPQQQQQQQQVPEPLRLAATGTGDGDVVFTNEGDAFEDSDLGQRRGRGGKQDYSGSVMQLTDAQAEMDRRKSKAAQGGLKFKYRNLGGFQDVGNVHPKNDYKKDESNQCLWDIVMVRLSLINEDFVHKSRYTSGQPFGFKHDVLVSRNAFDDEWEQEEVDSYQSAN